MALNCRHARLYFACQHWYPDFVSNEPHAHAGKLERLEQERQTRVDELTEAAAKVSKCRASEL